MKLEIEWQFAIASDKEICIDAAMELIKQGRSVAIQLNSKVDGWAILWVESPHQTRKEKDDKRP